MAKYIVPSGTRGRIWKFASGDHSAGELLDATNRSGSASMDGVAKSGGETRLSQIRNDDWEQRWRVEQLAARQGELVGRGRAGPCKARLSTPPVNLRTPD